VNRYPSFAQAYVYELRNLIIDGEHTSPRGMETRERRWRQFAVDDPLTFPMKLDGRKLRDVIGVLEALSLVGQFSVPELFTDRVAKFSEFLDGGVFHGAYATRAHGALTDLVQLLERDPDSRQAVVSVFDSTRDLNRAKRDIPCTLSLHFMCRQRELNEVGEVELHVSMRSNDIWLGTPYDFVQFAVLQASVAQALGARPGLYVHTAGSLHLYERDLEKAMEVDGFYHEDPTPFPLWSVQGATPTEVMTAITERARRLCLLDPDLEPMTVFESWAHRLLKEGAR
jgi:thymidylate synthase